MYRNEYINYYHYFYYEYETGSRVRLRPRAVFRLVRARATGLTREQEREGQSVWETGRGV